MKTLVIIFESAHVSYVENIKENEIRDKEKMDFVMGEADTYMKKVKE